MKNLKIIFSIFGSIFLLLIIVTGLSYAQEPPVPAFTYQGQLALNGQPVTAACDFQFGLYDAAGGGNQFGITQTNSISVAAGLFTALLNDTNQFGPDAFNDEARWLEIGVQCPGDSGFTGLGRQALTAAPLAHYAASSGALNGLPLTTALPLTGQVLAWDGAAWGPAADAATTTYAAGFGLSLAGQTFAVLTDTVQARVTGACGAGYVIQQVNADGTVSCTPLSTATGDITSVSAGAGLSGGGASRAITLTVAFSGTGTAETVARSDHSHSGADITTPVATATLAYSATAAPWGGLSGIPADIADGDADTTYTAGTGLTLSGTQFSLTPTYRLPQSCADGQVPDWNGSGWSCLTPADGDITGVSAGAGLSGGGASGAITLTVAFSGTGAAETVARSDHSHSDVYPLLNHTHPGADITSPVATATLAYSATAAPWAGLTGIPADIADGDADTTYTAGVGLVLSGTQFSLTGVVTEAITATWATTATVADNADTVDGYHAGDFTPLGSSWAITGNNGTDPVVNFIGTTDNVSFTVRVNNAPAWRIVPYAASPNLIGGYSGNWLAPGVFGAVIGGGGQNGNLNRVVDHVGVVGGGQNNQAGSDNGNVGDNTLATVAGGANNTASGTVSAIGGGSTNTASGYISTVAGGRSNTASSNYAFVGGGLGNLATGNYAIVGGGYRNQASGPGDGAGVVAGGAYNVSAGDYSFIGGGAYNQVNGGGIYNAIVSGRSNLITTTEWANFIGGGYGNVISGTMGYATIGGGRQNNIGNSYVTIAGGRGNAAGGSYATVVGGQDNTASGGWAVAAGRANTVSGDYATVPGGVYASATHFGEMAYAGGGFAVAGDAQTSVYVLRRQYAMAAGTWHDLFLDGNSQRLTIAPGRTVTFDILVTGSTSAGESAGYRIEGLIENVGGVTALVGAPTVTTLGEDDAAWDVQVLASDALDALLPQVQGNGETIRWVARVNTAEVNW